MQTDLSAMLRRRAARLVADLEAAERDERVQAALLESAAILKEAAAERERPELVEVNGNG
jgi:hypothetical protein